MTAILISLLIITIVNVLAYIWAYRKQSDHLTDISYSACFIAVTLYFLLVYHDLTPGRILLSCMIFFWAIRLGGFLFFRIHRMGKDDRFDQFRGDAVGFLKFWLLQSISIWIIVLPVMIGLMATDLKVHVPALILWIVGWLIESITDWQKFIFKSRYLGSQIFSSGLYTYIRHPNYLGEILVWISIFWYVSPILSGWTWSSIISPLWVITLLVFVSGIPLIENTNKTNYKNNQLYPTYMNKTWRLVPFIY